MRQFLQLIEFEKKRAKYGTVGFVGDLYRPKIFRFVFHTFGGASEKKIAILGRCSRLSFAFSSSQEMQFNHSMPTLRAETPLKL